MKNKGKIKIVFLVLMVTSLVTGCWFSEPRRNEPKFISMNRTSYSIQTSVAYNSDFFVSALTNTKEGIQEDGGGQLDLDSIKFIIGTEIRPTGNPNSTHELVGVFDSITYINPRHLADEEYELVKERSFFNIENWIPKDNDFVYSVYDSDFEQLKRGITVTCHVKTHGLAFPIEPRSQQSLLTRSDDPYFAQYEK